jgi:hypothetical protein
VNEETFFEKIVKVRVVRGRVQSAGDCCKRDLLEDRIREVLDTVYKRPVRSFSISIHADTETIPFIEYHIEEMVLPTKEAAKKC